MPSNYRGWEGERMKCPVCNTKLEEDRGSHVIYCPAPDCGWYMEDCFDEDTVGNKDD